MSQVPYPQYPNPYAQQGYPPPPPPPPPGQYPQAGMYAMQPARTSGAAVTSLVCGLLLCIPFVTGLLAVVTGLVGMKTGRQPGRTGAGLATFGLLLGVLNLVGWGAATPKMIAVGKQAYGQVVAQNEVARQFIKDLSAGDVSAAAAKCHTTMPRESLEKAVETVKPWGAFQEASVASVNVQNSTDAGESWLVQGTAKYATGDRKFKVEFGKENGKWVIVEYNLKP
jgi:hypothetical protein